MMELKPIASFQVDHTKLTEGMYISRVDGDVVTYDIRMVRPNAGPIWAMARSTALNTCSPPMYAAAPCPGRSSTPAPWAARTGFYFLVRDMAPETAIRLVRETMAFIADYQGPIPGPPRRSAATTGSRTWREPGRRPEDAPHPEGLDGGKAGLLKEI